MLFLIGTLVRLIDRVEALSDDTIAEIWIQNSIKDKFVNALKEGFNTVKNADFEELDDHNSLEQLEALVKKESVKIVTGYFDNVKKDGIIVIEINTNTIAREKYRALTNRLAIIRTFNEYNELNKLSYIEDYTISVGIYSKNNKEVENLIDDLDVGNIAVNSLPETDFRIPQGSGINAQLGKFSGKYAFTNLTNMKPLFINNS